MASVSDPGARDPGDLERLLEEQAFKIGRLLDADTANALRWEGETLQVIGEWFADGREAATGHRYAFGGDTISARVIESSAPARIDSADDLKSDFARERWAELGIGASLGAPILVDGAVWGVVTVSRYAGREPFAAAAEDRLDDFAGLVAQAIANVEARRDMSALVEELRTSRARIVAAGDTARQRLERNLHDGAQQRLVSVSISLRVALVRLADDPEGSRALLEAAAEELTHALQDLRDLARGLHPAILSEHGLKPALEALTRRAQLPLTVANHVDCRLPAPVEAAAYYVVSEALANVTRYANATSVTVTVRCGDGQARVEVVDDGRGGAAMSEGSGLHGLADRVEALGGRIELDSPPGSGTTVRALIPLEG